MATFVVGRQSPATLTAGAWFKTLDADTVMSSFVPDCTAVVVRAGGTRSMMTVTDAEVDRPATFCAVHVNMVPGVSAVSVIGSHPCCALIARAGSLTTQATVTSVLLRPLALGVGESEAWTEGASGVGGGPEAGFGVFVGTRVSVGSGVRVSVAPAVAVTLLVGDAVGVTVWVGVSVTVGVTVTVVVGVRLDVPAGVGVAGTLAVCVAPASPPGGLFPVVPLAVTV